MSKRLENRLSILKDAILAKRLNVFDCLEHYELDDIWDGSRHEQQIKCPGFHGDDRRKSARVYENGTMFCWACDASYDIFAFEMKFTGQSFSDVVYELAQRYGIDYDTNGDDEDHEPKALSEIKDLFKSFEVKKPQRRFSDHFEQVSQKILLRRDSIPLEQYQRYWYVLDQIAWRVSLNTLPADQAIMHLDSIYREAVAERG